MNSASFDLSITALVLILDISRLTRLLRESGELTIRCYFRPCSHVTETQGFVQPKKNGKASENVQESEITL